MAYNPENDNDGVIESSLYATPMRNLIENKGLLTGKGMLYAGTGSSSEFIKNDKNEKIPVPVTTAIDPSNAADGSVLIKDSTQTGGWKVDKIGTAGIAAGAITSGQTHFEDKITIYPSNTTNASQPTVIGLPFAPSGSSRQVNLKLPSSSGQLINQDYVDDQKFASQIAKSTLAYGQYSTSSMALEPGQSITFTVTIIGETHENGGDASGIIQSATMGTPPFSDSSIWLRGGRVVSYTDTTVTLSFTNRENSTVYQVTWGINVSYAQPAYMALNVPKIGYRHFFHYQFRLPGSGNSPQPSVILFEIINDSKTRLVDNVYMERDITNLWQTAKGIVANGYLLTQTAINLNGSVLAANSLYNIIGIELNVSGEPYMMVFNNNPEIGEDGDVQNVKLSQLTKTNPICNETIVPFAMF